MLGREIMLGKRNSQGIRGMIQEEECMSNVKVIEYSDFKNFYADILPSGRLWNKLKGFVFRGQSSDKYLLLPSALREKNYKKLRLYSISGRQDHFGRWNKNNSDVSIDSSVIQFYLELMALKNFFKLSNNNGLQTPVVEEFWNSYDENFCKNFLNTQRCSEWPLPELLELSCLAQHHGIPTRLLDWTYDINVALYFASRGGVANENKSKFLVIYAINIETIQSIVEDIKIKFIVPSYSMNNNIKQQRGVLSYVVVNTDFKTDAYLSVDRTPVDSIVENYLQNNKFNIPLMYKILLPAEQSSFIFSYVHHLGYSASRLFSGYDGIVREMEEIQYLEDI